MPSLSQTLTRSPMFLLQSGESLASATGLKEAFHVFDSMFELASSPMPHILLPNFTRAKQVLLRALTAMMRHYESAADNGDAAVPPLVQKMREGLGSKGLNHWRTLVLSGIE